MGNKQSPEGVLPSIREQTFQFYSLLFHDSIGRREPSLLAPPVVYDWQAESSVPVLCPGHVCWDTVRLAIGQGVAPVQSSGLGIVVWKQHFGVQTLFEESSFFNVHEFSLCKLDVEQGEEVLHCNVICLAQRWLL